MAIERIDLAYVEDLARREAEAVGFLPSTRLAQLADAGQLLIARENGEAAGYLAYGSSGRILRVYQAAIDYDVRRREHGTALVLELVEAAIARQCGLITLWCAEDLAANEFWRAVGFELIATKDGGARRGRRLNRWAMAVPAVLTLGLVDAR